MMDFFLGYIADNYGNRPSANEGDRSELEFLRKTVAQLKTYGGQASNLSPGASTGDSEKPVSSSASSDDDEDYVDDLPQPVAKNRGPRMSVSAEVYGNFNKKQDYVAPVHPKTETQIAAIKKRIEGNFMFDTLNPVDRKSIIDAIVPVQKKSGEMIIK